MSRPYRVLQVGMSPNYGGTESFLYSVYGRIDRTEIQFDFLNVYDQPLAREDWLKSLGARVYSLKLKRRKGYFQYRRGISAFYKKHAADIDCVVCNVQSLDQIDMGVCAHKHGLKTILHLHNAGFGVRPKLLTRIAIARNKLCVHRYFDRFLACSNEAIKWGYAGRDMANVLVMNNGIAASMFAFDKKKRDGFRQMIGVNDDLTILYGNAGRMDAQKNQGFLIQAFWDVHKKVPNSKLVILGKGPLKNSLMKSINELGLGSDVIVLDYVEDIQSFYSGIDSFVFTSKFEGLGMVLLEAQCSGLPCVASETAIPQEAKISPLFHGVSGWRKKEWAEAMEEFQENRDRLGAWEYVRMANRTLDESATRYAQLLLG